MMNVSRIGPFALEERLGDGKTSSVYRAVHVQQHRSVALKVFSAPLVAKNPAAKAALIREVEMLKRLQHPHIARCYGGILEGSNGCIAYELVDGETLASMLSRRGRLAWETVVEYSQQISSALEHAHEQGIGHHDLELDKILVTSEQQLKIIDFRLDRARNPSCATSQKQTLARVKYQSPEQIRGEAEITLKADLYALGCLMFEMLVGQSPFPTDSVQELARHQLETPAPRIDSIVLDCPVWLDTLVVQLLEKDPSKRPPSATTVRLALEETQRKIAAGTSVLEHAAGGFTPLKVDVSQREARELMRKARRERAARSQRKATPFYERAWFLAACLLVLLGVVAVWALWPASEESLYARAKALMDSGDEVNWRTAQDRYLEPMLKKFPKGQHADEARAYIDQIEMATAEAKLRVKTRLGRPPSGEGERLYAEAWNYEQFGDRVTALDKYHSIVNLLDDKGADRPYVNLARRQIAAIERNASGNRSDFIERRLADAEQLATSGKTIEAHKIWRSIVSLYGNNQELAHLVAQAQSRLEGKKADTPGEEQRASSAKPPAP
jgi:predicted Ser/Thr protein kinase